MLRRLMLSALLSLTVFARADIFHSLPAAFKPRVEIVGVFVEDPRGRILLLHRTEEETQGNRWGVPGGGIERNESPIAAGRRELWEETGLNHTEDELRYLGRVYIKASECDFIYHMVATSYSGCPTNIQLAEREHKGFTWVLPEEALKLDLMEDEAPCITWAYQLPAT